MAILLAYQVGRLLLKDCRVKDPGGCSLWGSHLYRSNLPFMVETVDYIFKGDGGKGSSKIAWSTDKHLSRELLLKIISLVVSSCECYLNALTSARVQMLIEKLLL